MEAKLPNGCRRLPDGSYEVELREGGRVTLSPADVEKIGLLYDTVWIEGEVLSRLDKARRTLNEGSRRGCDFPFGRLTRDGVDRLCRLSESQLAALVGECVSAFEGETSYDALLAAFDLGGTTIAADLDFDARLGHVVTCENKSLAETVAAVGADTREDTEVEEVTR